MSFEIRLLTLGHHPSQLVIAVNLQDSDENLPMGRESHQNMFGILFGLSSPRVMDDISTLQK